MFLRNKCKWSSKQKSYLLRPRFGTYRPLAFSTAFKDSMPSSFSSVEVASTNMYLSKLEEVQEGFWIKIPSSPGRGGSCCQFMQWSIWVLFLHTLHTWSFSLFKSLGSEAFSILALSLYISFSRRSWQAFVSCSISRAFWSSGLPCEAKQNYCTDAKAAEENEPQVNGDQFNTWCFFLILQVYTYLYMFSWVDMERYFGMWSGWSHGLV